MFKNVHNISHQKKKKSIYINSYGAQSDPFQTNNTY